MHQTNLLDETLDRNQTHHYHLFIQCCTNGLSFGVCDSVRDKFIAFRHYPVAQSIKPEDIACIIAADDLLKLSYKSVSLLLNDGNNTLVPVSFFDSKDVSNYYEFTHGSGNVAVLYNNIHDIMAVNIFSYNEDCYIKLKQYFSELKVYHRTTSFLTNLLHESGKSNKSRFYVSIHNGLLDIGVAHSKKLEFFNTFQYQEGTDIIYHILNILEQFKLSVMHTEVFVSVDSDNYSDVFENLNNYIHHVKFIRPTDKFTYSYIFDEFQLTRFANLFNLSLCV